MWNKSKQQEPVDLFEQFKNQILSLDPVHFIEDNLTLDGGPFRLNGNGYKPFSDIYRYICLKAVEKDSRPVVLVKGRQVGATTMAAALEGYFMGCEIYGSSGRSPMRIMHLFPTLALASAYSKDKLDPIITQSKPMPGVIKSNGINKTFLEAKLDISSPSNNSLHFKKFVNGNQIWIESTGLKGDRIRGRQLCLDTELPTPDRGFIKLKDLKEGDQLFDENGKICNVTKVHPINLTPEAYKVTFDDGTTIDACAEHLWTTYTKKDRRLNRKPTVKNTKEILETIKVCGESNHSIPTCLPVEYPKQDLSVDPYLLGLWLGDGDRYGRIETADAEVLNNYNHRIIESSINHVGSFGVSKSSSYRVIGLTTALTDLGLVSNPGKKNKESGFYKKHIPDIYMHSSFEQRLALLQGLMDSDGCCGTDGRCEFVQVESRKELAYQVLELIQSLGIKASISQRESWRYNVKYQDKYRIQFYTNIPVFKLNRKLQNLKEKLTKSCNRFIKNIEPIESKPMRCITVDSPSHLYLVTRSFVATHNTVDCIFYDEVQDMSALAIGASSKILTQGKYGPPGQGVQVYFGTPKQKGGAYWKMWQNSNQQYYHLHCKSCEKFFPLYRPDINWEDVWIYGFTVKCTHCGFEQDKRDAAEKGRWLSIFGDPDLEKKCKMVGYHINQLYIPTFPRELVIAQKPEHSPTNTERIYMNEVLGEFYDGQGGTISKTEILEKCGEDRKFAKSINPEEGLKVYAGFDWGQKANLDVISGKRQGQSFSCAVILVARGPKLFSIEFATRLTKNDPQEKLDIVEEMFKRYNVQLSIGDIGDAHDLTHKLQTTYRDRFLASRAAQKVNGHIKFNNEIFPKEIVFERDYYISELFGLLKEGAIKFPCAEAHYSRIEWLIEHCSSMDVKVTSDRAGEPIRRFVKGSAPNDGFMALLNAYLAWKWDVSQRFNIKNPTNMKYENASGLASLSPVGGYCPNIR